MQIRQKLYRLLSHRFPSVAWTLLIFILLALPGSMLPNEKHFTVPQLDKFVHIILFGNFVFLWSFYFTSKRTTENLNGKYLRLALVASFYGFAMEVIQKYFIPNRDFDIYDIASDVLGAFIGYVLARMILQRLVNSTEKKYS
jgi:VanZ family protein